MNEPTIEAKAAMIEARDLSIEIEGRTIEAGCRSIEQGDDSIETEGAFFEETLRIVSIEDPSIEITRTPVEAICCFSSTLRAFVSTIESIASIEEAFTS